MSEHSDYRVCACGRDAIDVVSVASDDGLLLIPVCAECIEDPAAGEQQELFRLSDRRPLAAMPPRDDPQQPLPLADLTDADEEQGAA
jgi:hypothetical protein